MSNNELSCCWKYSYLEYQIILIYLRYTAILTKSSEITRENKYYGWIYKTRDIYFLPSDGDSGLLKVY